MTARAAARQLGRAARRRRDSAYHTSVRRSSDCAVVVTAEGASSVARAVPSDSVSCMLAAPRVPTDRFKRGVPAQGESPAPRSWKRRAARSRRVVRRSLQRADIMSHDTKRCILLEMDTSNTKGGIGSAFSLFYEGGRATVTVKITILNGPGALRLEPRHKTAMRDALK